MPEQADLDDITTGLATAMTAAARRSPAGQLPASDCPLLYSDEDPRNVWALDGRQRAAARTVELPFVGVRAIVEQRWRREPQLADASIAGDDDLEGHSTTGVCWDGAVVLADLLCHPPAVLAAWLGLGLVANPNPNPNPEPNPNPNPNPNQVLAAQSPNLARRYRAAGHTHRPWSWAWADKVVVELGCGTSALPSCAAALHGPRAVVCTDGNSRALPIASANTARWAKEHPTSTPVSAAQLRWGEGGEAAMLRSVGLSDAPVDVIIAADVFYVLDNPGGWGTLSITRWLRPRPVGSPEASFSAPDHASGCPEPRPASAN